MDAELRLEDDRDSGRLEARLGDEAVGFVEYRIGRGWIALQHTQVLPGQEGRGIGSRLAAAALDEARSRGLRVFVRCPFISAWLARHPEEARGVELGGSAGAEAGRTTDG
jgi:uncharacterized protein